MLNSAASQKNVNELTQLFAFTKIKNQPYFVLSVENARMGEEYLEKLHTNAKSHQLGNKLFLWDPENLSIKITKKDFILWQKAVLEDRFANCKRITLRQRLFFKCDDAFFTIPLKKDGTKLKANFKKSASTQGLNILFNYNEDDKIIEISSEDYSLFSQSFLKKQGSISINQRKFEHDKDNNCYFTCPMQEEKIKQTLDSLRSLLRKHKHATTILVLNKKLNRIEVSEMDFQIIQKLMKEASLPKILAYKRKFLERADCFYTIPRENETLDYLQKSLSNHFNSKYKEMNIKTTQDVQNNCLCIAKEDYIQWQDKLLRRMVHHKKGRNEQREFLWNKEKNCYVAKVFENERIETVFSTLLARCAGLNLPENIFYFNRGKNQIEISNENYLLYQEKNLNSKVQNFNAFHYSLTYDKKNNVYFYKKVKNGTRDFNVLAKFLDINVKFVNRNCRTELSVENYQTWIANPFIRKSLESSQPNSQLADSEVVPAPKVVSSPVSVPVTISEATSSIASSEPVPVKMMKETLQIPQNATEPEKASKFENPEKDIDSVRQKSAKNRSRKCQTAQNTPGRISAKYLEDALPSVPWGINSGSSHEERPDLSTKGHSIHFSALPSALLKESNKKFRFTIELNSQGIKANIRIYSSRRETMEHLLSKNPIFVRAGRKKEATLPTLHQNDSHVNIIVVMTQEEYNEMEESLGFPPVDRLPSHLKLCIIESCSLARQPVDQPSSYLRVSNVKRAVVYAIANKYDLKHFLLIDDNTTQIQIAEKVASEGSISALFKLFGQYKESGTVCATLGTYAPYKQIADPLDAVEMEEVREELGSKIMYINFEAIQGKLKAKNRELHEIVSPFSLIWGEDYYSQLAITLLMEDELRPGLVGVVPYHVAWHMRNQAQRNKAKSNGDFQLANGWLRVDPEVLKNLTQHQQQVVTMLQHLVSKAIEAQKEKERKYHELLAESAKADGEVGEPTVDILNLSTSVQSERQAIEVNQESNRVDPTIAIAQRAKERGNKAAKWGYELNIEKLTTTMNRQYKPEDAKAYIEAFIEGHQKRWDSLSVDTRAYNRGFKEGDKAANKGYKKVSATPSIYKEQSDIYLKGFRKGNTLRWEALKKTENQNEVENIATKMGADRARSGFEINDAKLSRIAEDFGQNQNCFEKAFRKGFESNWVSMSAEAVIIKKASHVAKKLSRDPFTQELNMEKLDQSSRKFGEHYKLYKETVAHQFQQLKQTNSQNNRSQRRMGSSSRNSLFKC